jgi:hypothetical protein
MKNEKIYKERLRVLDKLIREGYNTDKKIIDLKVENLIQQTNFSRTELTIAIGIKNALVNKKIITFLCNNEINESERKEKNYEQQI